MDALSKSLWIALLAALVGPAVGVGLAVFMFTAELVPVQPFSHGFLTSLTAAPSAPLTEAHNVHIASQPAAEQ